MSRQSNTLMHGTSAIVKMVIGASALAIVFSVIDGSPLAYFTLAIVIPGSVLIVCQVAWSELSGWKQIATHWAVYTLVGMIFGVIWYFIVFVPYYPLIRA